MATVLRALSEYKLCTSTVVFGRSRAISTTAVRNGLEEFFPRTDDPLEEAQKIGRPWRARELRHKSNADLHKLWFVLLKERNMLLTVKHEANRRGFIMPAPTRLGKVKNSMAMIKVVIGERERALKFAKNLLKKEEQETESETPLDNKK